MIFELVGKTTGQRNKRLCARDLKMNVIPKFWIRDKWVECLVGIRFLLIAEWNDMRRRLFSDNLNEIFNKSKFILYFLFYNQILTFFLFGNKFLRFLQHIRFSSKKKLFWLTVLHICLFCSWTAKVCKFKWMQIICVISIALK